MGKKREYVSLIYLRGIFILIIIFYHLGGNFGTILNKELEWCYEWGGHLGNTFFFMVSGFLITHGYSARISNGEISFVDYMIRRSVKIFPLYFLTNVFRLGLNIAIVGIHTLKFDELLRVIFMAASGWVTNITPYNDPTWFVCVLMICYIVYYFVGMIKGKNKDIYYGLVFLIVMYGRSISVLGMQIPFMRSGDGQGLYCFFLGVVLYEIITSSYKNLNRVLLYMSNFLSFLFLILAYNNGVSTMTNDVPMVISLFNAVLNKGLVRIVSVKPMVLLGKISMSLYFIHGPWIALYHMIQKVCILGECNLYVQYSIIVGVLLVISLVSYFYIEPVFEKWTRFIFKRNIDN